MSRDFGRQDGFQFEERRLAAQKLYKLRRKPLRDDVPGFVLFSSLS